MSSLPRACVLGVCVALTALVNGCGGDVGTDTPDGAADSSVGSVDAPATDTARADTTGDVSLGDTSTTCPTAVPTDKTACGPIHFTCSYPDSCGTDFAQCVDGTWTVIKPSCTTDFCPYAGPTPGGACKTDGFVCEYPKASGPDAFDTCTLCVCKSGAYVCEPHPIAECPLPTCKGGDACTPPGMIRCEFGGKCGTTCTCETTGKLTCSSRPC